MNAPSFLIIVISFAVLMYWYMVNLKEAKNGNTGLFGMKRDRDVVVPGKSPIKKIKKPLQDHAAAERVRERVKDMGAASGSLLAKKTAKDARPDQVVEEEVVPDAPKSVTAPVLTSGKSYRFKQSADAQNETKAAAQNDPTDDDNRLRRRLAGKAYKTRNREPDEVIDPKVDQDFFDGTA